MLFVLVTAVSFAQQITINVETQGTLSSLIAKSKKDLITDLKLTGEINIKDVIFIKEMRSLENLDIKDVISFDDDIVGITGFQKSQIKNIILPMNLQKISYCAFEDCKHLEAITFFDGIKEIGSSAFSGCSTLSSLDLPNSLETICTSAFYGCESLKSIIIPNSVTSIKGNSYGETEKGTFEGCTSLESIVLSENITSVPEKFVRNCTSLQSIVFPDNVREIGNGALDGCTNLKTIVIGKKVASMYGVFNKLFGCKSLENVIFKCRGIYSKWLQGTTIKNVTFEKNVQEIGESVFADCTNLESIYIPSSISSIGIGAFKGCTGLQEITVDESNPNFSALNNILLNKDQTALITFANNSSDNLTIPETVTNIEKYAFYACNNLKSIAIPASVTEIGGNVFEGCANLEEIYSYTTTPPAVQSTTFTGVDKWLCTLYVPVGSYSAYWLVPGWGDFINIKEYDPTGIQTITDCTTDKEHYYSVDGRELTSTNTGINIVKSKNGTTKKIFIK